MSSTDNRRAVGPRLDYGAEAAVSQLQAERIARGWTQAELGRRLAKALLRDRPYTRGYIHLIEIRAWRPPGSILLGLSRVFGRSPKVIESWLASVESRETAA